MSPNPEYFSDSDSGSEIYTPKSPKRQKMNEMSGSDITKIYGYTALLFKREKEHRKELDISTTTKHNEKEKYSSEDYKNQYKQLLEYKGNTPEKLTGEVIATMTGIIRKKLREMAKEGINCLNDIVEK